MRDVTAVVEPLQEAWAKIFVPGPGGTAVVDPDRLVPSDKIAVAGWHVLDRSSPDGVTVTPVKYADIHLDRAKEAGKVWALERDSGDTRLFFVWAPPALLSELAAGGASGVDVHVLFHPPTYETCYRNTPYWNGRCRDWHGKSCSADMQDQHLYVRLGLRYTAVDFLAIAHHLVAQRGRKPRMAYVLPVADNRDFADLTRPDQLMNVLGEIANFLRAAVRPGTQAQTPVGKVMLSAYSRSGTRLLGDGGKMGLFQHLDSHKDFFARHLIQVNAFDINLADKPKQRMETFVPLWAAVLRWRGLNRAARAFVYTAYADHLAHVLTARPGLFTERQEVNLEEVPWSDETLRAPKGPVRGRGVEAYGDDGKVGVLHLPPTFFQEYIRNGPDPRDFVGNVRGMEHRPAHGHGHGHGWFMRSLMSHALGHGDPSLFAGPRT
ncbi:hypothetical protein [Embleya sp. NBC_00896]|uniref:hypothetical protein n=1 Tax=Embleya sp. NBC_00896 TaxID=2975961 RepID=UPI002F90E82B|nr:hypothetical protein OG928_33160 [Embleya sp. NBC_00896]